MSATTLIPRGLRINNPNRQIERVQVEPEDFSLFNHKETLRRIKFELESSSVVTTISTNKFQQIENIIFLKAFFIKKRNNILDNFFKYYNPYYRIKLKKIDKQLDEFDLQLYTLESENKLFEASLDKAIESAQEKLREITQPQQKHFK